MTEPRRRLTEPEHDRAWHAIEGIDWEAGPDPDTVLNAVLGALGIDPPEVDEMAASLRRDGFGDDEITEILRPGQPSLTAIAGTRPPAGDPDCQCLPASPMAPRIYADCCLPAADPTP